MRKVTGFVIAVLLMSAWIMGCREQVGKREVVADSSDSEEVTLQWWAFPSFAQEHESDAPGTYEEKLIQLFEEKYPHIKVELTMLDFTTGPEKLSHVLASRRECDVLFDAPGRIIEYGKEGYLEDLNDMFNKVFVEDVNNDSLLRACKDDKTAYMYPISSAPFYMAFNRAMLQDAGVLELVREGWTTDDFTTVLEALRKKGYVAGAVFCKDQGGDQGTRAFVANLFDSAITDETASEYTIADAGGIEAIQYLKQCVDKGLLVNGTYMNGSDAVLNFANGRASFSLLWGPSQQNSYNKILKDNGIEVVEVPFPSKGGKAELEYLVNGFCIMDNGDPEKIEAAKDFIRFLCDDKIIGPENIIRTGCIPVRTSTGNLYPELRMEKIMAWTEYYAPYYNTMDGFSKMRQEWTLMLKNVMNGYEEPGKALKLFEDRSNVR